MIKFKEISPNLKNLYFTSDLHGYHKNIVRGITAWEGEGILGCRGFNTLEEMNTTIINGINATVGENDILIHCGDWTFGGRDKVELFRNQINCKTIYGIQGNH